MTFPFSWYRPIKLTNFLRAELTLKILRYDNNIRNLSQTHKIAIDDGTLVVNSENHYECIADRMEPLRNMPYEKQLDWKYNYTLEILEKLGNRIEKLKQGGNVKNCIVEKVSPSPVLEHYRNKDEFSIQNGVDGNPKTVGFFVGSPADSEVICVPATHLSIIKEEHKALAEVYQNFIRSSELPACHKLNDGGCFRQFTVRSNSEGQTMAIAVSHPGNRLPQEFAKEQEEMLAFFQKSGRMPTSFYHQICRHHKCTNDQSPLTLLHGDEFLTENILGYEFRISPDAFFQINVKAAEVMYEEIVRLAKLKPSTTVLDLCCGTGTISIVTSKRVRGCIGIETVKDAVKDARINASNNNVLNCEFIHGTVESTLFFALQDLDLAYHLVTVVNPGRGGLNKNVMEMILKCDLIKQLIYVSCAADNPNTMSNFIQLTKPDKKKKYRPFALTKIKPIDLFPQTRHCELLMVFNR